VPELWLDDTDFRLGKRGKLLICKILKKSSYPFEGYPGSVRQRAGREIPVE
jgi:hypothetical protein